jgi:hypothetical protein
MPMYFYDVEFVFEYMVIIVNVGFNNPPDELEDTDDFVIEQASQTLINNYKIDPSVLYLQDVIVHERD